MTILVADDDQIYRETVCNYAKIKGLTVIEASSGNEAYASIQTSPVDGQITDLRMGNGTGIELMRKIRNNSQSIPKIPKIIVNTGMIEGGESYLKALGASFIFLKPLDVANLVKTMIDLLSESQKT